MHCAAIDCIDFVAESIQSMMVLPSNSTLFSDHAMSRGAKLTEPKMTGANKY